MVVFGKDVNNMVSKLKLRRLELGLKQKDVAKQVGITPQYLMNLENGKAKNPSINIMKDISSILDYPVQELFFNQEAAATANGTK